MTIGRIDWLQIRMPMRTCIEFKKCPDRIAKYNFENAADPLFLSVPSYLHISTDILSHGGAILLLRGVLTALKKSGIHLW